MKNYLRWDGYRVVHQGIDRGCGIFISFGWLCGNTGNSDTDVRVGIYHEADVGYTYRTV